MPMLGIARRGPDGMKAALRAGVGLIAVLCSFALLLSSVGAALAQSDPPVADAGPDAIIDSGTYYLFDGSNSTDDGEIVSFKWTFTYGNITRDFYGDNFTFKFTISGTYVVTLNVTDDEGNYDTDTVTITVRKAKVNILATYWPLFLMGGLIAAVILLLYLIVAGWLSFVSEATRGRVRLTLIGARKVTWQVLKNRMGLIGVIILSFFAVLSIFGPWFAPYTMDDQFDHYLPQSEEHWMGTDAFGKDIFSELFYGAQTSMIVGIFSAFIASFLGAAVGLYSGFVGGWKDEVIMRANDVVLSIPWLVLMIIVAAMLGKIDLLGLILIIGLTGWSFTARMVRAQVLSVKERQFVERARAIGSSELAIIRRHIFPNTFPLVFANTILTIAVSILSEATLSFLGLRPQGSVTWGTMLSYASSANAFFLGMHWWIIAPGLCIVFVVLGFTLLGYALDDILNPKLRKR